MASNISVLILIICSINIINSPIKRNKYLKKFKSTNLREYKTKRTLQYETDLDESAESEESYYYIKLFEFTLNEKEINLTIYCEPQISEDISLLLSFWIHTINSIGEFLENPNYEFKIFAKNTSNIYTLNMNKLNFGRFTEISNLNLLKIDYTNIN